MNARHRLMHTLTDIVWPDRPGRATGLSLILRSRLNELTIAIERELRRVPAPDLHRICDTLTDFLTTAGVGEDVNHPGSHPDLRTHLRTELDQHIASELMPPSDMISLSGPHLDRRLSLVRAVRQTGHTIIDHLAGIEDIYRTMRHKLKFVTDTQYCLTLDLVPRELYPDIAASAAQQEEWQHLYGISPLTADDLASQPFLIVDTVHFSREFTARLLSAVDHLDQRCDGLVIHSANFDALNLIRNRYRSRIHCLYTDPPFNTNDIGFTYRNEYPQSEWSAMMRDTLELVRPVLTPTGVAAAAIDDRELHHLGLICDGVFGHDGRLGILTVEIKPSGRTNDNFLATSHEYYLLYGPDPQRTRISFFELTEAQRNMYIHTDSLGPYRWRDFIRTGGYATPRERPNSCYPIYHCPQTGQISLDPTDGSDEIWPVDSSGRMRVWRKIRTSFITHLEAGEIRIAQTRDGRPKVQIIDRIKSGTRPKSVWTGKRYDAASHGTKLLDAMFGQPGVFTFPKSIHAAEDVIHIATGTDPHPLILDCFAGSGTTGHAVINLNRRDGGGRKYIMVEMGGHFDTVLLPRLKKAVYSNHWKDGHPAGQGTSHMVKYMRLESYQDALAAVVPAGECGQAGIRYVLDGRSTGVVPQLAADILDHTAAAADVVETFNWLLGLTVRRHSLRGGFTVVEGQDPDGRRILIVWSDPAGEQRPSETTSEDFLHRLGCGDEGQFDLIYTNGPCPQDGGPNHRFWPIEPEFSRLMFGHTNTADRGRANLSCHTPGTCHTP